MRWIRPLRLRSAGGGEAGRKVTWLELFFDLIFVAAVSQVAAPLRESFTPGELLRFTTLFLLIWWAWIGHTFYATRFDTDDVIQRLLTLTQIFIVAVMAANAKDALDSRSSAGFAAAYAVMRLVLVLQYARARRLPQAQALATRHLTGHGVAAALWLASAFAGVPVRFWIWGVALAVDVSTPLLALPHTVHVPPDAAHLPERFGLFTLILLGESVVDVMHGMETQDGWSVPAALSAFLGMAITFLIWWWYFDGIEATADRLVRSRREAVHFQIWSYGHFPLYLGIAVAGIGLGRIVSGGGHMRLAGADAVILGAALAAVMVAMTVIAATVSGRRRGVASHRRLLLHGALAALTLGAPAAAAPVPAFAVVMALAGLCVAQLGVSTRGMASRRVRPA
jgi:low temperature requirement protein LtrA